MSKKLRIKLFSILLSLVCIACIIFIFIFFINLPERNSNFSENDKLIVHNYSNDIMKLSSQRMIETDDDGEKIVVIATVSPNEAVNKTLSWELKWADNYNATISNYVKINVSEDSFKCYIEYIKPFSHQLVLTAKSVSNPKISASCTIDCYKQIDSFKIASAKAKIGDDINSLTEVELTISASNRTINFTNLFNEERTFKAIWFDEIIPQITLIGTTEIGISKNEYIELSNEVCKILASNSIPYKSINLSLDELKGMTLYEVLCYFLTDLDTATDQQFADVVCLLDAEDCWFNLCCNYLASYDGSCYYFESFDYRLIGFNVSHYKNVTSIELSDSSIIL